MSGYPRLARKSKMMMRNKESSKSAHFINVYAVDDTRGSFGDSWPLYVIGDSGLGFFLAHGPNDVLPLNNVNTVQTHGGPLVSSLCGVATTTKKRRGSVRSSRISEAERVDCGRGASPRCPLYSSCQVMRLILAYSLLLALFVALVRRRPVPMLQHQIYGGKGSLCIIRNQTFWAYRRQL